MKIYCRSPRGNVNWNMVLSMSWNDNAVVPHVGTWIEITSPVAAYTALHVVPHVGTWIEILSMLLIWLWQLSFPTWERELKSNVLNFYDDKNVVVPHVGTWIEILYEKVRVTRLPGRSPRGNVNWNIDNAIYKACKSSRSPRGNVNWNRDAGLPARRAIVVPHVGTWIEIPSVLFLTNSFTVVPHVGTWIEICQEAGCQRHRHGRSPRGNVNWNWFLRPELHTASWSFPTWERELKFQVGDKMEWLWRRSPRGNVNWNLPFLSQSPVNWQVVPHVGTWIEIFQCPASCSERSVVPHVGTWIEI